MPVANPSGAAIGGSGTVSLEEASGYILTDNVNVGIGSDVGVGGLSQKDSENNHFLMLETNTLYDVVLDGYVSSANDDQSSYASIFIDPRFTYAGDLYPDVTLEFSAGAGNMTGSPAGLPEPSSWVMMIFGLVGLGSVMRVDRQGARLAHLR